MMKRVRRSTVNESISIDNFSTYIYNFISPFLVEERKEKKTNNHTIITKKQFN